MKSLGPGYLCRKFWNFQLDQLSSPIIGLPTLVITNYHTIYLLMRTCTETCTQTQGGTGTELSNVCYYAIWWVHMVSMVGPIQLWPITMDTSAGSVHMDTT